MRRPPVAITIAGSDSGGGAGIVADLKTFEAHGVWGTCALAAVTAQNTVGVQGFEEISPALVRAQVRSVTEDIGVDAAKTGMLASRELVVAVAEALGEAGVSSLVVDPVMVSKHGDTLLEDAAADALMEALVPLATVVTPNTEEASRLVGFPVDDRDSMAEAAYALVEAGAATALVKGGHLVGEESPDCLLAAGSQPVWLEAPRLPDAHTHGTGCVLSAAICSELARGMDPSDACLAGKRFTEKAISAGLALGRGVGPVNPGWERSLYKPTV